MRCPRSIRRLLPFALLALLLPPGIRADTFFPYPVHSETLDNGLRVILIAMSSGGLVEHRTLVRTGSRDEYEPGRTGFAHFFEHMMFRGTEKYPSELYNEKTTSLGINVNAYTSDDLTVYLMSTTAGDLEQVLDLESDRFRNLSYPEQPFKTEAGAVYGEYRKNRMLPMFMLSEKIQAAAFREHTYGHTTMGYEDDIRNMPEMFEYSLAFFDRYYRPENVILLIAGEIEVKPTMELVRRYYGSWEKGYEPPQVPVEAPQTEERRVEVEYPGRSLPMLSLSYKAGAFDPADRTLNAAELLCGLLFGETSPLYKKLVLDQQVVESIHAGLGVHRDPGLIDILVRVKDPDRIGGVLAEIDAAIAEARSAPPDPGRLADLRSRIRYQFLMGLDTPSRVAQSLTRLIAVTGGIEAVETLFATYEQITPDDVMAAATTYFVPERRTVGVLRGRS